MKTVSEILGHEDLATTMIYVHLLGDKIKQISNSFAVQPQNLNGLDFMSLRLTHNTSVTFGSLPDGVRDFGGKRKKDLRSYLQKPLFSFRKIWLRG